MKQISTNELQDQLSKIIREVEAGEVFQVSRYSKPVAFLMSKEEFERLASQSNCKGCIEDLRKLANKVSEDK